MAAPSSGTPQSGRKRQAVAPAPVSTTAASSATPGRGGNRNGASNGSSRAASMASPRGSSLLTPEPAQKRRGVSRAATGRSAGHEGGGGGGSGNSATPTSVFTPGTGTAHLLLQLRRDWPQQQQQQQLSPSGGNAPPLPLQSGDGGGDGDEVGSTLAGQENPSEDAAALIRSCAYAVAPSGSGGHGSDSSICDKRDRPPPPSGAAAAGNTGGGGDGAAKAPRGASSSRRNDRRAPRPASCGSRRGRGSGGNSTNANGARKPALTSAAPAAGAAFSADRPGNEGVGAPAGVGSSGLVATGSGVPLGEAAAPAAASIALDGCSCKKSMCLKLYCQCFAGQHVCSDACKCENCLNSDAHGAERRAAVRELLCRSPHAFDAKFKTEVLTAGGGTGAARAAVVHNTGCGCSKSACLKRYCECFNGGIACSEKCRCKDCRNTAEAVGARVRAKNMATKSSMLSAAGAVSARAGPGGVAAQGRGRGGGGGGGGAMITGGVDRGPAGGAFSGEVASAATAAAVAAAAAAAAAVQRGRTAKTMVPSTEEEEAGRQQDVGRGMGNIDVGGGGDGAAAIGRSPLGVLPGGRADGDRDSGANRRSTIRV